MNTTIRLNDVAFANLKKLSIWYETKTPTDTINLLIRKAMESLGLEVTKSSEVEAMESFGIERDDSKDDIFPLTHAAGKASDGGKERLIPTPNEPEVTFTRVIGAKVNGNLIHRCNWNRLLIAVIKEVKSEGFTPGEMVQELNIRSREGVYNDNGFKHLPEVGISSQGQPANDAWREVSRLAKKHGIDVHVRVEWYNKPGAQNPGKVTDLKI